MKLKKRSSPSLSGRLIPEGLHIYCQDTTINLLNICYYFFFYFSQKQVRLFRKPQNKKVWPYISKMDEDILQFL